MKPLVIIPARGGSKRIPRKNIVDINGQPALSILILKLKEMNLFEEIVVSTSDEEISRIAIQHGAVVANRSTASLSNDVTPSEEVVRDFIFQNKLHNSEIPIICIYPLALLLTKESIQEALSHLGEAPDKFVISAGKIPINPLRHTFIMINESIEVLFPQNNEKRSQDLEAAFFDVGMFYLAYPKVWISKNEYWYNNNARVVIIPDESCIDVDTEADLNKLKIKLSESEQN